MKIWISLFAVLYFAGIGRAQAPQESPNVPLKNQAYADLDFLTDDSFRCFPAPPLDQRISMTRYEFAIAVARLCRFPSDLSDPIAQSKANYEAAIRNAFSGTNDQKVGAIARLFSEFKPELHQLGIADEQIKFAQTELNFLVKLYSGVPLDSSAYDDLNKIAFHGLAPWHSQGFHSHFSLSRYEFMINVARILDNIYRQNDPAPYIYGPDINSRVEESYREVFEKNPEVADSFVRLLKEFSRELVIALGFTEMQIKFAQIEISAGRVNTLWDSSQSTPSPKLPIAAPFRDVPKTHWAFDAVERLRQSGIVIGNPDGAFAK